MSSSSLLGQSHQKGERETEEKANNCKIVISAVVEQYCII
jgi:hypothetical protein